MADWYLKHGEKEYGPMDSSKLKQLAAQNKIRPTDYIRRGADGKWTLASHAKGLFSETASNDPSAPSPINVHSGDANVGATTPVPPVAPTPSPAFTQTPNVQTPIAPPRAVAIPVAQKAASSTSSSMSFGDGIEFTPSSPSPSSPKKGKKGKKKGSAPTNNKTVLIAGAAGGAVLVLILIIVLVIVLRGKKENSNNVPPSEQTNAQANEEGTASEENVQAEPGDGEEALPNEDGQNPENADSQDEQPSEQVSIPENVYDSATQSAKVGDMEIKVVSIRQGTEPIITKGGAEEESPDRSTIITVSVQNINPQKTVKFTPWSISLSSGKKSYISLTDKENTYGFALKPGEYSKNVKKETKTLYSDDPPVTDVLIFERYVPGAKELFLTLPVPGNPAQSVVFSIKTENVGGSTETAKTEDAKTENAETEDAVQKEKETDLSDSQAEPAGNSLLDEEEDEDVSMYREPSVEQQNEEQKRLDAELKKERGF